MAQTSSPTSNCAMRPRPQPSPRASDRPDGPPRVLRTPSERGTLARDFSGLVPSIVDRTSTRLDCRRGSRELGASGIARGVGGRRGALS